MSKAEVECRSFWNLEPEICVADRMGSFREASLRALKGACKLFSKLAHGIRQSLLVYVWIVPGGMDTPLTTQKARSYARSYGKGVAWLLQCELFIVLWILIVAARLRGDGFQGDHVYYHRRINLKEL